MDSLSEEEDNYVRMCLLLTGITPRAVRALFDREFAPAVLSTTLKREYKSLRRLYNSRILNQTQWQILKSNQPDSNDFDIPLMICLLTNLTPIPGYEREPFPTDLSTGADLARVRNYRNYLAHLKDCRIDNTYFVTAWNDISVSEAELQSRKDVICLTQITGFTVLYLDLNAIGRLGGSWFLQECTDLKSKVLDKTNQEIFREIKRSQNEINILKQALVETSTDLQDVKEKLEDFERLSKDVIPPSLKEITTAKLETWIEDDRCFVTTVAAEHILACIQTNRFVIVTGNSGVGKTATVRHVALRLQQQGYIIVPTSKPEDIVNIYRKVPKTVFVVDDLCGRFTLNQQYVDSLKQLLDDIKIILVKSGCKIIATCRLQVFRDEKFKIFSILEYVECNMNSKDLSLADDEKSQLAEVYYGENKDKFIELYNKLDCFPLLCKLLSTKTFELLSQNPFDCFTKEFDDFINGGQFTGQYKFCALCLVAIFDNYLEENYLTDEDSIKKTIIESVMVKCKLDKCSSLENILDALNTLDGSLVVKIDDVYSMIHDKMFDFVAYYFGQKMIDLFIEHSDIGFISERFLWENPEIAINNVEFTIMLPDNKLDKYIHRMILDWEDGCVVNVFCNRNMDYFGFRRKFLDNLTKINMDTQVTLAGMVDYRNGTTTLMGSCFIGDLRLTEWILDCLHLGGDVLTKVNECSSDGASPVFIVCQEGHLEILNRLIEYKADINKCCKNGASPLYIACLRGHLQILNRLIECKADIHKCCEDGASPVYIACMNGHLDILNRLIECKADINKCCEDGASPVYISCENDHLDILNRLIECEADINKCSENGASPVYISCENGHLEILNRLIECKADIHKCCEDGASPVYISCENGHLDILNRLIECEADINKCSEHGASPVYISCENGHLEILKRLIECKADIHKCCEDGASPVYIACMNGHLDILNRLIECKADINKCCEDGASPVYISCENDHLDILNRLIECEADINKCFENGASPVYISCENGHLEILNRLIECKADIHKCCEDGASPVYIACMNGHLDILNRLIECKADINKCCEDGASPVYISCENDHLDILNRLIECEADINKCSENGASPVYISCENGHLEILNRLIECKADIHKCCEDGASPVYIACMNGHLDILNRLIECKADIHKCCKDGAPPVYISCENGHLEILNRLIECKADINKCCEYGASPVYISCENGHLQLLNRLIECKADIHKCCKDGASPVYISCEHGHLEILNRLIECKADITKCCEDGASPVYISCQNGHLQLLNRLIECKADINKCREDGASPVYIACENGQLEILNRLIECKADINKCCEDGASPVYAACQKGHLQILNRLIECNADVNKCCKNGASPEYIARQEGHLDILNRLKKRKSMTQDLHINQNTTKKRKTETNTNIIN